VWEGYSLTWTEEGEGFYCGQETFVYGRDGKGGRKGRRPPGPGCEWHLHVLSLAVTNFVTLSSGRARREIPGEKGRGVRLTPRLVGPPRDSEGTLKPSVHFIWVLKLDIVTGRVNEFRDFGETGKDFSCLPLVHWKTPPLAKICL
jgi:hypothetical protein